MTVLETYQLVLADDSPQINVLLNTVQLAVLVALLEWVRRGSNNGK